MSFEKWTEGELDARTSALVDDLIHFGKQHIRDAYNEIDALSAKLHAAEEKEAGLRKALEEQAEKSSYICFDARQLLCMTQAQHLVVTRAEAMKFEKRVEELEATTKSSKAALSNLAGEG